MCCQSQSATHSTCLIQLALRMDRLVASLERDTCSFNALFVLRQATYYPGHRQRIARCHPEILSNLLGIFQFAIYTDDPLPRLAPAEVEERAVTTGNLNAPEHTSTIDVQDDEPLQAPETNDTVAESQPQPSQASNGILNDTSNAVNEKPAPLQPDVASEEALPSSQVTNTTNENGSMQERTLGRSNALRMEVNPEGLLSMNHDPSTETPAVSMADSTFPACSSLDERKFAERKNKKDNSGETTGLGDCSNLPLPDENQRTPVHTQDQRTETCDKTVHEHEASPSESSKATSNQRWTLSSPPIANKYLWPQRTTLQQQPSIYDACIDPLNVTCAFVLSRGEASSTEMVKLKEIEHRKEGAGKLRKMIEQYWRRTNRREAKKSLYFPKSRGKYTRNIRRSFKGAVHRVTLL